MRALTVQQPWAWAIVHGGKNIENRTQMWTYRGPLAIHAGLRFSDRGGQSPLILRHAGYADAPMVFGAIIGVVDLVDVHPASGCCQPWGEESYIEHGGTKRIDVVHMVLENPRAVDPIPCTGRLSVWTLPADLEAAVLA